MPRRHALLLPLLAVIVAATSPDPTHAVVTGQPRFFIHLGPPVLV